MALLTVVFFDIFRLVQPLFTFFRPCLILRKQREPSPSLSFSARFVQNQKTERSEEMFDKNTDYAINKRDDNAIVYRSADGHIITLTSSDFATEQEFRRWKEWSDADYHRSERAEHRRADREIPMESCPAKVLHETGPSDQPDPEELISQRILLHHALRTLSKVQYIRFMLYMRGFTISEIARTEGVSWQAVSKSCSAARKRLADFLNNL